MASIDELENPPAEFSLMPFWFWNDELSDAELLRQIDDFEKHGVSGFVIHPRVGLPRDTGWMSDKLLGFMHTAIDEAARRRMKVILYDEGMYPSGSSSGQIVERWPELACRCLALHDPAQPLPADVNIIGSIRDDAGADKFVVDRRANSYIRGLHYIGDGPKEDELPAGDILNIRTTEGIIELIYAPFAKHFKKHLGSTVLGIFTDEPSPLGKSRERGVMPGTTGVLEHVSRLLGYDFTPHLATLWSKDPAAKRYRDDYRRAIRMRMNETWYKPLSDFCASQNIALCGHPDAGDEIGVQRFFQYPGQDLVWRFVEPGKETALQGGESTQGKCTSSAMINMGRRRNSNEFAGAYGVQTTFDEIEWLANWCLVRGVNLLIPHAFYYSVRGPRQDERPPQIGPWTKEWETFKPFADHCRRLCWVNTDSQHICDLAILTNEDRCPWPAAAVCLTNQKDFNYLDPDTLLDHAIVDADGIRVADMKYRLLVIDDDKPLRAEVIEKLQPLIMAGRVVWFGVSTNPHSIPAVIAPEDLLEEIGRFCAKQISLATLQPDLRVRYVAKAGAHFYILFNEGSTHFQTQVTIEQPGAVRMFNPATYAQTAASSTFDLSLTPHEVKLVIIEPA